MKIVILCVGRLKDDAERAIVERYVQRLSQVGPPLGHTGVSVIDIPESKARAAAERKAGEADELRRRMPAGSRHAALDEHGKMLSSAEFAAWLGRMRDNGQRELCFLIGGPDGLDPELAQSATLALSFGRMTLPHGLARAALAEQLYRAATILAGHPYHRE
jgi:23S rRNA (pseudouridine1915-N3)-methyltransferase